MYKLLSFAQSHADRIAIKDPSGSYSYGDLLRDSERLTYRFLSGKRDLEEARIAFMVRPGYDYVVMQWAIWRAGAIAVPICVSYPAPSIAYLLEDAQVERVITTDEFHSLLTPICEEVAIPCISYGIEKHISIQAADLPTIDPQRRALIVYTSGTTGKPKGVVSTHRMLEAQISMLVEAWAWGKDDHILNILPLHHVHGIVNILLCALWSGACCEFLPRFHPAKVMEVFKRGEVNLFMAVPTIYYKLIAFYDECSIGEQEKISSYLKRFRLMVSGSAALPVSTLEKWKQISGQTLLERYGMTEMGMAISNPYHGERRPGHIGQPLPGVIVRLVDEDGKEVQNGAQGEIQVKGPNVFSEYWGKPEATKEAFTTEGWFRTGDMAQLKEGYYKILGRNSVDILKSGGYKISALEIEEVLRTYPGIKDCGVVGIPDEEWGERVVAGLVIRDTAIDEEKLKEWLKGQLPAYKIPRRFEILEDLPRNALGKVTKNELKKIF